MATKKPIQKTVPGKTAKSVEQADLFSNIDEVEITELEPASSKSLQSGGIHRVNHHLC